MSSHWGCPMPGVPSVRTAGCDGLLRTHVLSRPDWTPSLHQGLGRRRELFSQPRTAFCCDRHSLTLKVWSPCCPCPMGACQGFHRASFPHRYLQGPLAFWVSVNGAGQYSRVRRAALSSWRTCPPLGCFLDGRRYKAQPFIFDLSMS